MVLLILSLFLPILLFLLIIVYIFLDIYENHKGIKKYLIIFTVITVGVCSFRVWFYFKFSSEYFIKKNVGINVKKCKKIKKDDNHGGFHGDGEEIIVYDCSKEKDNLNKSKMKELPLTENLDLIMYGGTKDDTQYGYGLAIKNDIPKIENGYYYFYDDYAKQYEDNYDYNSDYKLFDRSSFNFRIIMFDIDTNYLYYYELDT